MCELVEMCGNIVSKCVVMEKEDEGKDFQTAQSRGCQLIAFPGYLRISLA